MKKFEKISRVALAITGNASAISVLKTVEKVNEYDGKEWATTYRVTAWQPRPAPYVPTPPSQTKG